LFLVLATVAGFTPFVLLLNPVYLGLDAAWGRIEETFIAIVLYLVVDICIFPQRIYPLIKKSVLFNIEKSRDIFKESIIAVELILKFEKISIPSKEERVDEIHQLTWKDTLKNMEDATTSEIKEEETRSKLQKGDLKHPVHLPPVLKLPSPPSLIPPLQSQSTVGRSKSHSLTNPPVIGTNCGGGGGGDVNRSFLLDESYQYGDYIGSRYRANSAISSVPSSPTVSRKYDDLSASKHSVTVGNRLGRSSSAVEQPPVSSSSLTKLSFLIPSLTSRSKASVLLNGEEDDDIEKDGKAVTTLKLEARSPSIITSPVNDEVTIKELKAIYEQCKLSLDKADIQLKAMKAELDKQSSYLTLIVYEPNLFFYNFPSSSYHDLFLKFKNVYRSSLALNNGSRALIILICQMLLKKENIIHQLNHLLFMIKHLFLITSKSEVALSAAAEAFHR
jgi:hypothetical protein